MVKRQSKSINKPATASFFVSSSPTLSSAGSFLFLCSFLKKNLANFKMALYGPNRDGNLPETLLLTAANGKTMPAKPVFVAYVTAMKEDVSVTDRGRPHPRKP